MFLRTLLEWLLAILVIVGLFVALMLVLVGPYFWMACAVAGFFLGIGAQLGFLKWKALGGTVLFLSAVKCASWIVKSDGARDWLFLDILVGGPFSSCSSSDRSCGRSTKTEKR